MTAYLFDVDGVLTDPVEKRVIAPELFSLLLSLLQRGDLVAFNTGRSIEWVTERIIQPFWQSTDHRELFSEVIIVGEKGGAWTTFDHAGNQNHHKDQEMVVPPELNQQIRQLTGERYNESMFFDSTKETMISVEMHDRFSLSEFHRRQEELVKEIETLLQQTGFSTKYKIDPSTISTDIEEKHAGKALGVDRFLSLIAEKEINPSKFVTFGDSASDFAMADELEKRGKEVTFVYTGDKEKLGEIKKSYPIVYVKGYSQGTREFLKHSLAMVENHN